MKPETIDKNAHLGYFGLFLMFVGAVIILGIMFKANATLGFFVLAVILIMVGSGIILSEG